MRIGMPRRTRSGCGSPRPPRRPARWHHPPRPPGPAGAAGTGATCPPVGRSRRRTSAPACAAPPRSRRPRARRPSRSPRARRRGERMGSWAPAPRAAAARHRRARRREAGPAPPRRDPAGPARRSPSPARPTPATGGTQASLPPSTAGRRRPHPHPQPDPRRHPRHPGHLRCQGRVLVRAQVHHPQRRGPREPDRVPYSSGHPHRPARRGDPRAGVRPHDREPGPDVHELVPVVRMFADGSGEVSGRTAHDEMWLVSHRAPFSRHQSAE